MDRVHDLERISNLESKNSSAKEQSYSGMQAKTPRFRISDLRRDEAKFGIELKPNLWNTSPPGLSNNVDIRASIA